MLTFSPDAQAAFESDLRPFLEKLQVSVARATYDDRNKIVHLALYLPDPTDRDTRRDVLERITDLERDSDFEFVTDVTFIWGAYTA